MVSVLPGAVFVHVPKNAGSAISRNLTGRRDDYWPTHVPWRTLEPHVDGKPGFGFIRNPWHRMVSLYFFLLNSPVRHERRVPVKQHARMGFRRWLLEGDTFMSNEPVDGTIWIRQNQKYLPVTPGNTYLGIELLDHPTTGMPPMQRRPSMWWLDGLPEENIGKVETLDADMARFASMFDFPFSPVASLNRTARKPQNWRAQYDEETVEFVREHHDWDIKFGGYTFN